uniref:Uncharacterized protein n=1 Tax=Candidozyma auris TaxID=498019 RepID=A0A0L0NZA4_CANAR
MTAEKKELYKLLLLPQSLLFLVSSSLDFPLQPHIKRRDGIWGIFVVAILKISPKRKSHNFFPEISSPGGPMRDKNLSEVESRSPLDKDLNTGAYFLKVVDFILQFRIAISSRINFNLK